MLKPQTLSEKLIFSTVRLQGNGSVGSGFFFNFRVDNKTQIPVIITNKHVVEKPDVFSFALHEKKINEQNPSGNFINIEYKSKWIGHPNKDVDLCATPLQPLVEQVKGRDNIHVYYSSFDENLIWNDSKLEELSAIEDVTMIGYPIGIWDHINNFPIVRKGITSIHPAVNFQGKSQGVIDMACFPGSSGSPIILLNEGFYATKKATSVGSRIALLGILFSGPTYNSEGEIVIKEIPTKKTIKTKNSNMINLGFYIKAKEILELKKEFFKQLKIGK